MQNLRNFSKLARSWSRSFSESFFDSDSSKIAAFSFSKRAWVRELNCCVIFFSFLRVGLLVSLYPKSSAEVRFSDSLVALFLEFSESIFLVFWASKERVKLLKICIAKAYFIGHYLPWNYGRRSSFSLYY